MTRHIFRLTRRFALAAGAAAAIMLPGDPTQPLSGAASAQELSGGTLTVALSNDMTNYDPMQFSTVNFFLIKNLYDSVIEYTPEGEAIPSLAKEWSIADDNASVTVTLREDVDFQSGNHFDAEALTATLEKATDPERGKNVYSTMSIVDDWNVDSEYELTINFNEPVPTKQILDLLQFTIPIDPEGIDDVETVPAGTGPFKLEDRAVGQSVTLTANDDYWREGQPILDEIEFTIFSDASAAASALESGGVDLIYDASSRNGVRLRDAGYQLIRGPGKLVQVFRINSTEPPFDNKKFRQAFNYLMNRPAIIKVGYSGLGEPTALPWVPASPAFDAALNEEYAFDTEKAQALLDESGLSDEAMSDWSLLVNGSDEQSTLISQIVQSTVAEVGIDIDLDVRQGAEFIDALLTGDFAAVFGGVGNAQKFPSRISTNSIYRTQNNPVFGDPHPHPAYVEAIERVNGAIGEEEAQAAYDHLNEVLLDEAFGIPTNTYETGLTIASPDLGGFTLDIDNLLVGRTIGFK